MTRTGITAAMLALLHEPTPPDEIKKRQGNRKHEGNCDKQYGVCRLPHAELDYVDARHVMGKLDALGGENWQDRYEDRTDGSVRCGIGILVDGEWVWKWDVGDPSDIEANKGVHSEAFKRAAVKWGIARDLYGHSTNGRAPANPPASAAPVGGLPEEPPELAATFDHRTDVQRDDSRCPVHDKPWRTNARGYYCATKVGDGWCREQPVAAYMAAQER